MIILQQGGQRGFAWIRDMIARLAVRYHHFAHPTILVIFNSSLAEGEVNIYVSWFLRLGISQTFRYFNLAIGFILDDASPNV